MFGHCIVFCILGVVDVPKVVPRTNAEIATATKIGIKRYLFRNLISC